MRIFLGAFVCCLVVAQHIATPTDWTASCYELHGRLLDARVGSTYCEPDGVATNAVPAAGCADDEVACEVKEYDFDLPSPLAGKVTLAKRCKGAGDTYKAECSEITEVAVEDTTGTRVPADDPSMDCSSSRTTYVCEQKYLRKKENIVLGGGGVGNLDEWILVPWGCQAQAGTTADVRCEGSKANYDSTCAQ